MIPHLDFGFAIRAVLVLGFATTFGPPVPAQSPDKTKSAPLLDPYGDPLPEGAIARLGTKRFRHNYGSDLVAYFPDGKRILSADELDGSVCVWDSQTGKELQRFSATRKASNGQIIPADTRALAVSSDSAQFAYAGYTGEVFVRESASGNLLRQFKVNEGPVSALAFSPDHRLLAVGDWNGHVEIWEWKAAKRIRSWTMAKNDSSRFVSFIADGKQLLWSDGGEDLQIWDIAKDKIIRKLTAGSGRESAWDQPVACTSVTHRIAAVTRDWNEDIFKFICGVRIWDARTGAVLRNILLQAEDLPQSLAFSPDGKTLAGGGKGLRLWDANTGKLIKTIAASGAEIKSLSFGPDGKRIACAQEAVRVWDLETAKEDPELPAHPAAIYSIAVTANGKFVAAASGNEVHIWDIAAHKKKQVLRGHRKAVRTVGFGLNDKILASDGDDGRINLWDWSTGKVLHVLKGREPEVNFFTGLIFTPDGKLLVTPGKDGYNVWHPDTGKLARVLTDVTGLPCSMAFSKDGNWFATGHGSFEDGAKIRLIDWKTGKQVREIKTITADTLAFSTDGKALSAGGEIWSFGTLAQFATATGKERWKVEPRELGPNGMEVWTFAQATSIRTLALTPDDQLLAAGTGRGFRLIAPASGKELRRKEDYGTGVPALAFASNGKVLITAGWDGTLLLWDVSKLLKNRG